MLVWKNADVARLGIDSAQAVPLYDLTLDLSGKNAEKNDASARRM